jgi:Flp pilus assembly pilin Flp
MLPILFTVHSLVRRRLGAGTSGESGQTSAEYALVLLGAAMVAMLVVAWARSTGKVGDLLDGILEDIIDTAS